MPAILLTQYHDLGTNVVATINLQSGYNGMIIYGASGGATSVITSGTVANDMDFVIYWNGDSNANVCTVLGTAMPTGTSGLSQLIRCHYNAVTATWNVRFIPNMSTAFLTNAMVKALAGIDVNKLAAQTANRAAQFGATGFLEPSAVSITELAILDGATITTTELNYLMGATSNIQAQIDALDLWEVGAGTNSLKDDRSTSATGDNSTAVGVSSISSGIGGQAIGFQAQSTAVGGQAIGAGANNSGTSGQAIGNGAENTQTNGTAIGVTSSNTGVNGQAIGLNADNSGLDGQAIGSESQNTATQGQALGYGATNRIASSTNIGGAIVVRSSDGTGNEYLNQAGAQVYIFSDEFDAKTTQTVTIGAIPTGVRIFVDEVGIIATSANTVTVQPTVSYGISGNNALFIAAAITSGLTVAGARERKTSILTAAGQTSLTAEVTIGATATTLMCRVYFKCVIVENQ